MSKDASDQYREFMKLFDPANVSKMFDPQSFMENFGVNPGDLDPQETIRKARENFDAMTKANEAAAKSYRDLMEKQMQIFRDVTAEAAEQVKAAPNADAKAAYQNAVRRALEIMTELSEAAHKANNDAYEAVKTQVDKTIKDLKS